MAVPTVVRYESPERFLDHAESWLLVDEDRYNLFLSLAYARVATGRSEPGALWLVVEHEGTVVGCALRTPPHKLLTSGMPLEAVPELVAVLAEAYDEIPAVLGPDATAEAIAMAWAGVQGGGWRPGMEQGVYRLDRVVPPDGVPGTMRVARPDEVELAIEWGEGFARDTGIGFPTARAVIESWVEHGVLHVWEDAGSAVSIAVAHGRTPSGVRVGYVYTPDQRRRRGYASALVAALSQKMLDEGCAFCVLYTDLSNQTSNAVYQRIGYRLIERVRDFDLVAAGAW